MKQSCTIQGLFFLCHNQRGDKMKEKKYKTDYVKIASSIFITEFEKKYSVNPTGIIFNKYLTLIPLKQSSRSLIIVSILQCWHSFRYVCAVFSLFLPFPRLRSFASGSDGQLIPRLSARMGGRLHFRFRPPFGTRPSFLLPAVTV